jgi:hypothetical protein
MPSVDHGVASGLWGLFFALFLWFGMALIGVDGATAFILGWLAGGTIFLFVRKFGESEPRTARRSRARARKSSH